MFLTSPRNSITAQTKLFEQLKCKTLLSPNPRPPPVKAILAAVQLSVIEVPSVEHLLEHQYKPFVFNRTFPEVLSEPLFAV